MGYRMPAVPSDVEWKSQRGYVKVRDMDTSHLVNVLRILMGRIHTYEYESEFYYETRLYIFAMLNEVKARGERVPDAMWWVFLDTGADQTPEQRYAELKTAYYGAPRYNAWEDAYLPDANDDYGDD